MAIIPMSDRGDGELPRLVVADDPLVLVLHLPSWSLGHRFCLRYTVEQQSCMPWSLILRTCAVHHRLKLLFRRAMRGSPCLLLKSPACCSQNHDSTRPSAYQPVRPQMRPVPETQRFGSSMVYAYEKFLTLTMYQRETYFSFPMSLHGAF